MKKIYFIILMMFFGALQAQIITIPDANFKAKLLAADVTNSIASTAFNVNIKIDTNNNGEIEVSEAQQVGILRLYGGGISNFTGISGFTNLGSLEISGNPVVSLDLSSNVNLGLLNIAQCPQLISLNLTNCNSLIRVELSGISITTLDLHNRPSLKDVYIFNVPLTSLNVNGCPLMDGLSVENTQLTSFDGSGLPNVFVFYVRHNPLLSSINFANSNIQVIDISDNNLSSVVIENQSNLRNVNCSDNNLTALNFPGCPGLMALNCDNNLLTSLNLSGYPLLISLSCSNNSIDVLDLSHNPAFTSIVCNGNGLSFLNLKNGKTQESYPFGVINNPNLVICCDDSEAAMIQNVISNPTFYPNYSITNYCSFTPGGTFYTVQGNTRYDLNSNGCDVNDPGKAFQRFNIVSGSVSGSIISNNSGDFSIPVIAGSHTITPVLENPTYFNISPASLAANFPGQANPFTQNFCMTANGTHPDLEVVIIPTENAVPGFDADYKIVFKNKGTIPQSGNIVFNFNDNLMNFLSATTTPNSQSTGVLNWNFTNLLPFESREIKVKFILNSPTQTLPLHSGDILHYTVQINGAADETPLDNNFTLSQAVVNSFDPNDKTCLEGSAISQTQIGNYVHYLIRFENNGTANAKNIVVKDNIDLSKFDLSTLIPLSGSHNFVTRISGTNTVEFIFENIQLPFDDANNDGYVSFKVKTNSALTVGDSFSNTAKIYFDYNAPIVTNTYTTSVQNVLATSEIADHKSGFSIYPNPVKDILNIQSKDEVTKAEIYDAAGRIISTTGVKNNAVDVSGLSNGNYIIRIFTKNKTMMLKFIKS